MLSDLIHPLKLTTIQDAHGNLCRPVELRIRENAMSTNVDPIRDFAEREYKWGFVSDIEEERIPKGLNEDVIRLISEKKKEPEFMLEWRLKAYRHWASLEKAQAEPKWANIKYTPNRLSGHRLLLRAQAETRAGEPERARPGDSAHLREAGHSAGRTEDAGRSRRGCGLRQRFGGHDLQGKAGGGGSHLLFVFRGGAEASGAGAEISRHA